MNEQVSKTEILAQARGVPSSQATQIEQSRAIAQVQGALVVAQQRPRDEITAMERIRAACAHPELANRAFFAYSRSGSQVTGPTIHFATELARCWGNVDFGIAELARNDTKGESEMLAVAWDLETNARVSNTFQVPHRRDKKGGAAILTDMRDIYENNANMGARRLRECLLRIIPVYVRSEAATLCRETLEHGGGVPIEQRREKLLEAFAEIKVTRSQIETRIGRSADRLTPVDIANLGIVYQSLKRGETTLEDEFPAETAAAVSKSLKTPVKKTGKAKEETTGKPPLDDAGEPEDAPDEPEGGESAGQGEGAPQGELLDDESDPLPEDVFLDELQAALAKATTVKAVQTIHGINEGHIRALSDSNRTAALGVIQSRMRAVRE